MRRVGWRSFLMLELASSTNLCPANVMAYLGLKTHFDLFCFSLVFLNLFTSKPSIISKISATHNSRELWILYRSRLEQKHLKKSCHLEDFLSALICQYPLLPSSLKNIWHLSFQRVIPLLWVICNVAFLLLYLYLLGPTDTNGLTNWVGLVTDSSTSSVISRYNSPFNFPRKAIGTCLASVMTGVSLGFTDTLCVLERDFLYRKPSL